MPMSKRAKQFEFFCYRDLIWSTPTQPSATNFSLTMAFSSHSSFALCTMTTPAVPIIYPDGTVIYDQPDNEILFYEAPDALPTLNTTNSQFECAICLDYLSSEATLRISSCRHIFHQRCLVGAMHTKNMRLCPLCRSPITDSYGSSPSGVMTVTPLSSTPCPGFSCSTLQLDYTIPSGLQLSCHETPGAPYQGATRTAYLPDNARGRALLARLQAAWRQGLLFVVGTSQTTGMKNTVCWSAVPQKTSLCVGAQHGFPDPHYLQNCHDALDSLHVPSAAELEDFPDCLVYEADNKKAGHSGLAMALEPCATIIPMDSFTRAPVGESPSGILMIEKMDDDEWYSLTYDIPSGIQKAYHPAPGVRYGGSTTTTRVAYFPVAHVHVLQRLKYAWEHGLVFRVGKSLTTGVDNAVVWAGIPHKTSRTGGGPFGFPDDTYIEELEARLNSLKVPASLP